MILNIQATTSTRQDGNFIDLVIIRQHEEQERGFRRQEFAYHLDEPITDIAIAEAIRRALTMPESEACKFNLNPFRLMAP